MSDEGHSYSSKSGQETVEFQALDKDETLEEVLRGQLVFEFPTLYVQLTKDY